MTNKSLISSAQPKIMANYLARCILKECGEMVRVWVSKGGDIEIPLSSHLSEDRIKKALQKCPGIEYKEKRCSLIFAADKTRGKWE